MVEESARRAHSSHTQGLERKSSEYTLRLPCQHGSKRDVATSLRF